MNIFDIFPFFSGIVILSTGNAVLLKNPRSPVHRAYWATCLLLANNAFVSFAVLQARTADAASFWLQMGSLWPFALSAILHFVFLFCEHPLFSRFKLLNSLHYLPSAAIFLLYRLTDLPFGQPYHYSHPLPHLPAIKPLIVVINAWVALASFLAVWVCWRKYRKVQDGLRRKQLLFVLLGLVVSIAAGGITRGLFPVLGIASKTGIAFFGTLLSTGFIAFAILRYGLFSLRSSGVVESIVSRISDALALVTLEGRIVYANRMFLNLLGTQRDQVFGTSVEELFPPAEEYHIIDSPLVGYREKELIGKSLLRLGILPADQIPKAAAAMAQNELGKPAGPEEFTLVRKDGAKVCVEVRAHPVRINDQDLVLGIAQDTTERKRSLQAIEDLVSFAELNPAPLIKTETDGTIVLANQSAADLFGKPDLQGRSWFSIGATRAASYEELLDEDNKGQEECRIGEWSYLFSYAFDRATDQIYIYGADLTRLKQLESHLYQNQKIYALGHLAGGIAHDFGTLVGIIIGHGKLLQKEVPEGGAAHKRVRELLLAANRAKELIRHINTFARPDEGKPRRVKLAALLDECLPLLRSYAAAPIHWKTTGRSMAGFTTAEVSHMKQIIMNLGMNAVDAAGDTHDGAVEVSLEEIELDCGQSALRGFPPGRYVKLEVKDNGHGIKPELLERIFEPFFSTKSAGKGTGLGLSVVYQIVDNHGGFMTIDSAPGRGSTFSVYLPSAARTEIMNGEGS